MNNTSPESKRPVVLVVEEEDGVRTLLRLALDRLGFTVLAAATGQEAIGIYQQSGPTIDIVLMDVRMRGLDGPATLEELRKLNPQIRCCFMTGDTAVSRGKELLSQGALHVFRKPFPSMSQLADSLREIIKEAESGEN